MSLENKKRDSTVLKIGDSAKVVIKQDMKGRRHKYGFNNNKREKPEKVGFIGACEALQHYGVSVGVVACLLE